jgi:hypothetical protein
MTAAPSIKSQLRSAISDVQSKAAEVSSGEYHQDVAADRAAQAHNVTKVKENLVSARQRELDNILEQLSPPPTKEVSEGGKNGGTKTVVDKEEVARLEKEKTSVMAQLENVRQDVEEARSEAAEATTAALTAANVTQDKQSEMAALMNQINSINDSLSQGQNVDDDQIKDVIDKFKTISEGFTREDNVSGAISKAFYNPMKDAMERMLGHLNNPNRASGASDSSANSSDSTSSTQQTTSSTDSSSTTQQTTTDQTSSDQASSSGSTDSSNSSDDASSSQNQTINPVGTGASGG